MPLTSRSTGIAIASVLLSWPLLSLNRPSIAQSCPTDEVTGCEADITAQAAPEEESERPRRLNYVGLGGTVGLSDDGETELGNGGFSIMSRTSFTDLLALHTASVIGGDGYSTFALTGSYPVGSPDTERPAVVPFAGAGLGVEFEDFDVDPMVTAGVDIPITDSVTGTARVNANFGEDGTDIGVVLGVGIRLFR